MASFALFFKLALVAAQYNLGYYLIGCSGDPPTSNPTSTWTHVWGTNTRFADWADQVHDVPCMMASHTQGLSAAGRMDRDLGPEKNTSQQPSDRFKSDLRKVLNELLGMFFRLFIFFLIFFSYLLHISLQQPRLNNLVSSSLKAQTPLP